MYPEYIGKLNAVILGREATKSSAGANLTRDKEIRMI
jgi:hypothetical protein